MNNEIEILISCPKWIAITYTILFIITILLYLIRNLLADIIKLIKKEGEKNE